MADSGQYDDATLLRRQKIAEALFADAMKPRKIEHWTQGLAQMAQAGVQGLALNNYEQQARENEAALAATYGKLLGQSPAAATAPVANPGATPPMGANVAAAMSGAPDASMPRGFRNNNPGNIQDGSFAQGLPGYAGTDGRFAKFASMDNGVGAMNSLLDSYEKRGFNTPNAIINRWAHPSDNNPTNAYAANVAKAAGLGPDDPVTPDKRQAIVQAMIQQENGRGLPQAPQAAAPAAPAPAAAPQADIKTRIAGMLNSPNPAERKIGMQLAQNVIAQSVKPADYDFKVAGDTLYRANPRTGAVEPVRDIGRGVKPMTEEQRREWKVPEGVAAGIDDNGKPVFSQPSAVNTVSPVVTGINERFDQQIKAAQAAPQVIASIHEGRRALDAGAITGAGAEPKLMLAKIGTMFGLPNEAVANTEVARAAVGNQVLESAKTLGANPSNTDRDYIEKVKGGSISLDETSMRRLMEMQERWARDSIKRANEAGKKLISTDPEKLGRFAPMLSVDEPLSYEDYVKNNPVKSNAPAGIAPPDRSAIEAEMRRRGLLK